jgi:nitroreductase
MPERTSVLEMPLLREINGVAAGLEKNQKFKNENEGQLRRNVHRLEKGLIMEPFRFPYARDYIAETVDIFAGVRKAHPNAHLTGWAQDVLTKYMSYVGEGSELVPLRKKFESVLTKHSPPPRSGDRARTPYAFTNSLPDNSYDALRNIVITRASVRHFDQRPVPAEVVENALDLARRAPSACNRQPFRYLLAQTWEHAQSIASISLGTGGYLHEISNIAVVIGDLSNFEEPRDRHLIYVDGSLSSMLFVLGLHSQKVGACCINWPDVEQKEAEIAELLGLKPYERPIMLIAFGYPKDAAQVPYSEKKSVQEILKYF